MPYGADSSGYSTAGDVLVSQDGVGLNVIWDQITQALDMWNQQRGALANLLSYQTINSGDAIPQGLVLDSFELASEFGQPTALRAPNEYALLGYTFEDYDRATRMTERFIRDATQEQILAQANLALAADNQLTQGLILNRLFNNGAELSPEGLTAYSAYNGDTMTVPPYLGKAFAANHNHYVVSGNTVIDSGDVETLAKTVREHGFGSDGSQLILLVNPEQLETISSWKAGQETATAIYAHYDFIPSQGAPAYLQPDNIVGTVAPGEYAGLKVSGSYGDLWVISSDFVPEDYFAIVATYGENDTRNAIGFRVHPKPVYQGLRIIEGGRIYPLIESTYSRACGVGFRRRGQAAVMQIKAAGSYEAPEIQL